MSDESIDRAGVERAVASCAASHRALIEHLRSQSADPSRPSVLPGWTVGHVLTHIARNGDSQLDMLAGRPQYPSVESRNADIEAGAHRSWDDLVADIARVCDAVDAAFASRDDWTGNALTVGGERPFAMLPLLRQREVEVHRADLDLDYGFADMPSDYVRRDLRVLEMLWTARQPMGLTSLPAAARALDPGTRLAWFMGRVDVDGLDAAGIF